MRFCALTLAMLAITQTQVQAQVDAGIAPGGYTAALTSPTAQVLPTGVAVLALTDYLDGQGIQNQGKNYVLGAGLWQDHLEVMGRLASNYESRNCFYEACGMRDLSASLKLKLPVNLPSWAGWTPDLAIGASDVGGQTGTFRTLYGVGSLSHENWQVSAGYAKASLKGKRGSRLDGAFASVIYQPWSWLQGVVEYDSQDVQGGVRLFSPPGQLPMGLQVFADARTGTKANGQEGRELWWGIGAKIPLGYSHAAASPAGAGSQQPSDGSVPSQGAGDVATSLPMDSAVKPSGSDAATIATQRVQLQQALVQAGFQDVQVQWQAHRDRWIVQVENQIYGWNDLDAMGVALGIVHATVPQARHVELGVQREGWLVLKAQAPAAALQACFGQGQCQDIHWDDSNAASQTLGGRHGVNSSAWKPRLELSPAVNYAVGTEYGNLDYSLGYALTAELPLGWKGGVLEGRYMGELTHSEDYEPNRVFHASRIDSGLDRLMLHQYLPLGDGFALHGAVGTLYQNNHRGALAEGRWQSPLGQHKLGLTLGSFEASNSPQADRNTPVLLDYRYQVRNENVQVRLKAGRFFDGDRGFVASTRFLFDDTFIDLFYRSTRQDQANSKNDYVGVQLSVPLTPRRNWSNAYVNVRGNPDFQVGLQTRVGNAANYTAGSGVRGRFATVPASLDLKLYNRDRQSVRYAREHAHRLQEAYQAYQAR